MSWFESDDSREIRSAVVMGFFALGASGSVTFRVDCEAETISTNVRVQSAMVPPLLTFSVVEETTGKLS